MPMKSGGCPRVTLVAQGPAGSCRLGGRLGPRGQYLAANENYLVPCSQRAEQYGQPSGPL